MLPVYYTSLPPNTTYSTHTQSARFFAKTLILIQTREEKMIDFKLNVMKNKDKCLLTKIATFQKSLPQDSMHLGIFIGF